MKADSGFYARSKTRYPARAYVTIDGPGSVAMTLKRPDGKEFKITMTEAEALELSHMLSRPSIEEPAEYVHTPHGSATIKMIRAGHYEVAGGEAAVRMLPGGKRWVIDGSDEKYCTRYDAVSAVMKNL